METNVDCVGPPESTNSGRESIYRFLFADIDCESSEYIECLRDACCELLICKVRNPRSKDAKQLEATYALLSAILEDKQVTATSEAKLSHYVYVSSLYSVAIIKFFNILQSCWVDEYGSLKRNRKEGVNSLKSIAAAVGLPEWFVDCRNRICHSLQPSLIVLRQATFVALQWLRTNYWQQSYLTDINNSENDPTNSDIFEALSRLGDTNEKTRKAARNATLKWLKNEKTTYVVIGVAAQYLIKILCDFMEFTENVEESPPEEVQTIASPLLSLLSGSDALLSLLQEFVERFNDDDEHIMKASIIWFGSIVFAFSNKNSSLKIHSKSKSRQMKSGKQKIMWIKLLHSVVRNPNKHTPYLISCLQKVVGKLINEGTASLLRKLSAIYVDDVINASIDKFDVKTVEDISGIKGGDEIMDENNSND